jgi:hypothetical protein
MQNVDDVAHVQALSQPPRGRRPRVQPKSLGIVSCAKDFNGIAGHLRRRRDLGQHPAVRPVEPQLAVRFSIDQVALLVDGAVVPATEQGQVRERGGTAVRPVTDVMPLAEPDPAPREATATVSMVERPP